MRRIIATAFLLVLTVAGPTPARAQASFQALGDLPGGTFFSAALGVSADGATVVGFSRSEASGAEHEAFRWTAGGGMAGLGDFVGFIFDSEARDVSADGAVVVGYGASTSGREAFRWTQAGGMVGLGDLPGSAFDSEATGVSADGAVVVGRGISGGGNEAMRWTQAGGMVGLGDLPGSAFVSQAQGVSADGAVVVGYSLSASGEEAFRWTQAGGMVALGDLPGGGFFSPVQAVSADGSVVVGRSSSSSSTPPFSEAFRWTEADGMVGLGDFPGGTFSSAAGGVSADGSVVVGSGQSASGPEAFVWTASDGILSLQTLLGTAVPAGWTLRGAADVTVVGTDAIIVGTGMNPDGQTEAFRAVLPGVIVATEPSSPERGALALAVAPNPVRTPAAVRLTLARAQTVRAAVYDLLGRRVALLHDGILSAGTHALRLDASTFVPGVYVVRATGVDGATATRTISVSARSEIVRE
jgi:probable HAF family extracellular repeat protein